jgi:1,4-dihydroxy-2-naphthoyl-CoA synthase
VRRCRRRLAGRDLRLHRGSPGDHPRSHLALRPRPDRAGRREAATALAIGLVHEVADDLDAAVDAFVGETLKSGPEATRAAKRLIRKRPESGEELARIAAGLRAGEEGQEGLRAFLEKRKPGWIY